MRYCQESVQVILMRITYIVNVGYRVSVLFLVFFTFFWLVESWCFYNYKKLYLGWKKRFKNTVLMQLPWNKHSFFSSFSPRKAHNIDCVFKRTHGGVDSTFFFFLTACVGVALDWITALYFSLTYIHPPLLLTFCFPPLLLSLLDTFEQNEELQEFESSNIQREVKFQAHLCKHIFNRLKHQGQVLGSLWYVSVFLRSERLLWFRLPLPPWGVHHGGADQFTRNLELLMHWCKTEFSLKTDLRHSSSSADGYEQWGGEKPASCLLLVRL